MRKKKVSENGPEKFWGQSAIFTPHICKEDQFYPVNCNQHLYLTEVYANLDVQNILFLWIII